MNNLCRNILKTLAYFDVFNYPLTAEEIIQFLPGKNTKSAFHVKKDFDLLSIEGLCTIVPPSYIENFAEKFPKIFSLLCKKENALKNKWPWKYIGDYYIISLQKK